MGYREYGIGATSVGIKLRDGVILASEKRISYGGFIVSKTGKKVFKITDRMGIAFAGLFADMQMLTRILSLEVRFYELSMNRRITVKAAAKLLSNILYSQKMLPFLSETLIGGIDETGTHLYVLDALGSLIEDQYAALGSGAPIAIGIIESHYKPDMSLKLGEELAVKAIKASIERDAISGDGVDVLVISRDGAIEKFYPVK